MRLIDADALVKIKFHGYPEIEIVPSGVNAEAYKRGWNDAIDAIIECEPSIDAVQVIRCKDCKHRPTETDDEDMEYEFPDEKCPCQCDDGWYNWMPDDNWFCGNGERKES